MTSAIKFCLQLNTYRFFAKRTIIEGSMISRSSKSTMQITDLYRGTDESRCEPNL
jgi:hypothetical protein